MEGYWERLNPLKLDAAMQLGFDETENKLKIEYDNICYINLCFVDTLSWRE